MNTVIIAVAGRKQSGKSSLCSFIEASLVKEWGNESIGRQNMGRDPLEAAAPYIDFAQKPDGSVEWWEHYNSYYQHGDRTGTKNPIAPQTSYQVKTYNFADSLKQTCIDLFGLPNEVCYGTDEQKNQKTSLRWENLPLAVRWANSGIGASSEYDVFAQVFDAGGLPKSIRSGPMTGREVMQVFGTDVMRKMFDNDVWVRATLARIRREKPKVALIADMRFKTEFRALHEAGARVIRLDRKITNDTHASEIDLDDFPFEEFDRTLRITSGADLHEKNKQAMAWLASQAPATFRF